MDAHREELGAAPVVCCGVLVVQAALSCVQEGLPGEEQCCGEPVGFVFVLLVVAAEDHKPVGRDRVAQACAR